MYGNISRCRGRYSCVVIRENGKIGSRCDDRDRNQEKIRPYSIGKDTVIAKKWKINKKKFPED